MYSCINNVGKLDHEPSSVNLIMKWANLYIHIRSWWKGPSFKQVLQQCGYCIPYWKLRWFITQKMQVPYSSVIMQQHLKCGACWLCRLPKKVFKFTRTLKHGPCSASTHHSAAQILVFCWHFFNSTLKRCSLAKCASSLMNPFIYSL